MPGVRINLSKSGVSTSIGGKGATINFSKKGKRTTVGIPHSGISYSHFEARKTKGGRLSHYDLALHPKRETGSVFSALFCCAISVVLVLICLSGEIDSAMIRYFSYTVAVLSVIFMIFALIEQSLYAPIARLTASAGDLSIADDTVSIQNELRPVDRVWGWYVESIQKFNAANKQQAIALYQAGDAHNLDRYCRDLIDRDDKGYNA